MEKPVWTPEQNEAINARGTNILVSAAAGSGKTAVLVERIRKLIAEEGVSLDEMLIVTFTNAAASEMREKIVNAIPEQMDHIHKSHISTFHAFALEVIRRYFHLIGIEPGFRICDETQRTLLQTEAMEELFRSKFREENPDFLCFLRTYGSGKNEEGVKDMILETHAFIQSLPDPMSWLSGAADGLGRSVDEFVGTAAFAELLADLYELLEIAILSSEKAKDLFEVANFADLAGKVGEDVQLLREIRQTFKTEFSQGAALLRGMKFQRLTPAKARKEEYELLSEKTGALRQQAKDAVKTIQNRYCAKHLEEYVCEIRQTASCADSLYKLVEDFDRLYRAGKQKQGVIDFSDIEHYALEILSDEDAAGEYRGKFRYIFIDEYQDSNLVQECLIEKIRRPDNLFMVGDVKQSIYKFRLAEPEIFIGKYEKYRAGGDPNSRKIDLNRNFRSKGEIVTLVNDVFRQVMTKRRAGMAYDADAELKKGVTYDGPLDHPVEWILVDAKNDGGDVDDEIREMKQAELEAHTAASVIENAVGLPYYDAKAGTERKLRNRDIVILLRSTVNTAEIYYEALRRVGIPAYMDVGDGLFDTLEVSVFLNLLKVIDNRRQDIPLLSALRSPIFGFSVNELAEIRSCKARGSYFEAFVRYGTEGHEPNLRQKCTETLGKLGRWKQHARFLPLGDFAWELLEESGYYLFAGALPGGAQRQGNLRLLADRAASYEQTCAKGLFGFIRYIEILKKEKVPAPPIRLVGESDNVVRIMTVHKSKGLEFPMVLLGGLGKRFRTQSSDRIAFHKEIGIALKQIDREQHFARRTLLQEIIDRRRNREDLAEEIRILYVALTRAMDRLILLGSSRDAEKTLQSAEIAANAGIFQENSYLDFLLPVIGFSPRVRRNLVARKDISTEKQASENRKAMLFSAAENGFMGVAPALSEEIERRLSWEYPYPNARKVKSKYSVSELSREAACTAGHTRESRDALFSSQAEGANRGTVYHKVMERIPFPAGGMSETEIRAFLADLTRKEILTKADAATVDPRRIAQFFGSPLGKSVCTAENVWRELPFTLRKEREGESVLIQGTVDCCFLKNGKYILLDYKTNAVRNDTESLSEIAEIYRPQLALYREALEEIRGVKIAETWLYLFSTGAELRL